MPATCLSADSASRRSTHVGWVERSDTHRWHRPEPHGYRKLHPSYQGVLLRGQQSAVREQARSYEEHADATQESPHVIADGVRSYGSGNDGVSQREASPTCF